MGNITISELNSEATALNDNDLLLISKQSADGTTYTSMKMKGSVLKSGGTQCSFSTDAVKNACESAIDEKNVSTITENAVKNACKTAIKEKNVSTITEDYIKQIVYDSQPDAFYWSLVCSPSQVTYNTSITLSSTMKGCVCCPNATTVNGNKITTSTDKLFFLVSPHVDYIKDLRLDSVLIGRCSGSDYANKTFYSDCNRLEIEDSDTEYDVPIMRLNCNIVNLPNCMTIEPRGAISAKSSIVKGISQLLAPSLSLITGTKTLFEYISTYIDISSVSKTIFTSQLFTALSNSYTGGCIAKCSDGYLKYKNNSWIEYNI